jgi:hypothetical protein
MSEAVTRSAFAACLDTDFIVVANPDAPFPLRLIQVNEGYANPGWDTFTLLFQGPPQNFLPQATYRLRHEQLGELDIFLVPVGQDKSGFHYEAVFNRRLPSV